MPLTEAQSILTGAFTCLLDSRRCRDKREFLVAHGIRLFHRKGVNATGLAEILSEAKMGKSQFYHYFENKEDFVCEVLRTEMKFFLRRFGDVMKSLTRLEDFDRWFEPYIGLGTLPDNLGCPVGVIACEMGPSSEKIRQTAMEMMAQWAGSLSEGLSRLQSNAPLRAEFDPLASANYVASTVQGALLLGRTFRTDHYVRQASGEIRRYLESWKV